MSVQAISWVFDFSESTLSDRLVLLSIANHTNGQGYAWPSVDTISEEAKIDRRTVQRSLETLAEIGEVSTETGGSGAKDTNRYHMPKFWVWYTGIRAAKGGKISAAEGGILSNKGGNLPPDPKGNQSQKHPSLEAPEIQIQATPPTEEERINPRESYSLAKRIYRRHARGQLGNLGEHHGEAWASLLGRHGEDVVLGALEIWAKEVGPRGKNLTYPIAVFLKNADEYVEAFQIEKEPAPSQEEDDGMTTAADIRRERMGK